MTKRMFGVMVAVVLALSAGRAAPVAQSAGCGIDLRLLVLSADGREPSLQAITRTLDYLGTPYDRYVATEHVNGITPDLLADGCHAKYQAILQTTLDLATSTASGYAPAITASEFDTLAAYQQRFRIRNVSWYTFPSEPLGFSGVTALDTTTTPVTMSLTAAGAAVFPYLQPGAAIPVRYAYTYRAYPADPSVTPLLTDSSGRALVALRAFPDGRETLLQTFDNNPNLLHSILLGYGLVNWATRGLFIGERHSYASPQIDDVFIDNNQWLAGTPCGADPETTTRTVRMTGADLQALAGWQRTRNAAGVTRDLRITMAFNGEGTTGIYRNDTLTPAARESPGTFYWVSHTYDHEYLDDLSYGASIDEIRLNDEVARGLGLTPYNSAAMVTPNISGLTNPAFMQAAVDRGIRYLVSDASKPGYGNPVPNAGIYNPLQPSVLMIPRHANNLFYNVTTPADWVHEYNCLYRAYWGRDFSYQDVLTYEGNELMLYLLRGENAPWMYHQPNLVAYDGSHSLLTDVLDRALDSYAHYVSWPVASPSMETLGAQIASRMQFISARVTATLDGDAIRITSDRGVTVPITGLRTATAEDYGGTSVARVDVPANATVTLPLPPAAGALPGAWDHRDVGVVGVAGSASYDAAAARFTISGAGADVWGTADAMQYAFVPVSGDVRITARVASIQNVAAWVKAGVMIRERLDPSSAHGFMLVAAGKGRAFQRRTVAGGLSTSTSTGTGTAPSWVRIEREGTTVRALSSADGQTWSLIGTDTIRMQSAVFAGLVVSSHTTAAAAVATFDSVSIEPIAPPPPAPPVNVAPSVTLAQPPGNATAPATVTLSATASDSDGTIARVAFFAGPTLLGSASSIPYSLTWSGVAAGAYTLTAVATDDRDAITTSAPITFTVAAAAPQPPPPGALPSGWGHQDIGAVGAAGTAVYDAAAGRFDVSGAGADIWGTADTLHYVYQPLAGDGRIVARIASVQYVAAWTKVGVMVRATLDAGSAQGSMLVSAGKGTAFQRRAGAGSTSVSTSGPLVAAPYWVRLERTGTLVTASVSPDGAAWTLIGSDTLALPATIYVGLAVSSHASSTLAAAAIDRVTVTPAQPTTVEPPPPPPPPPPSPAVPSGWSHQDLGAVGVAGETAYEGATGRLTVTGAGADVWGTADAFHYAWRPWSGDGTILARVASVENVAPWVKVGVMIRASTDPASAHAFMIVSAGKGLSFQRRTTAGGTTSSTSGGAGVAPCWVRLQRAGDVITAAVSSDGATWTPVGSDVVPMGPDVLVGLAVSSHLTSTAATAVFEEVVIK